jgi:1-acyl-sn-glycerol-3-phosphate acyltransferase
MAITIFFLSYFIFTMLLASIIPNVFIPLVIIFMPIFSFITVIIVYIFHFPFIRFARLDHPYKAYLMRTISFLCNRVFLRLLVTTKGLENVSKDSKLIIYANHKSYTDAFSLMQDFPRTIALTPKKSVMKLPLVSSWLKAYGVFPINRKSARETLEDFPKALHLIESKHVLLLFPEGSIQYRLREKIEYMKAGAFKIAHLAQSNILVCRYTGNDLLRKRVPFMTNTRDIEYLKFIPYDDIKSLSTTEVSTLVMNILNNSL